MNLIWAPSSRWVRWTPSQADWLNDLSSILPTSVTRPTLIAGPDGLTAAAAPVAAPVAPAAGLVAAAAAAGLVAAGAVVAAGLAAVVAVGVAAGVQAESASTSTSRI